MKVDPKDKEKGVTLLNVALRSVGFDIDYASTDLIVKCIKQVEMRGDQGTLADYVKIQVDHNEFWDKYIKSKEN